MLALLPRWSFVWAADMSTPTPTHTAVLRSVIKHWNEFGPEHGFDEVIDRAERALASLPAPQGEQQSDEQIIRAAVAAMPHTNPGVAEDLIQGFTMHTEAEDIVAIWRAASGASQTPR